MRELRDIAARAAALRRTGAPFALATVVRVEGSAYRREGARMLVESDGRATGAVSGGCLEGEVTLQTAEVLRAGRPRVVSFRLGGADPYLDAVLGFGTGCDGTVHLLLEPFDADASLSQTLDPLAFVADLEARRRITLATVFAADDPALVGCRAVRDDRPDGRRTSDVPEAMAEVLLTRPPGPHVVVGAWGRAEVLVEALRPPLHLVVLGDGPDAEPVVHLAARLGWQTTLVGTRPADELDARFAAADRRLLLPHADDVLRHLHPDDQTAAVTLTHNYLRDVALLRRLLTSPAFYVGALGSRSRAARLRADLEAAGLESEATQRLHAPVGLDLGAETPHEIALSIVAHVLATLRERSGGAMPRGHAADLEATTCSVRP